MDNIKKIEEISKLIRYYILSSTTEATSGHPTSSLSAVELMATLMFTGIFRYKMEDPDYLNNDRLIFSKGHATPLYYALWAVAGGINPSELQSFRKFNSPLEGHPTLNFKFADAATGSLGQGLGVGVGLALNAKYIDKLPYKTYVLIGDGETEEGSIWESANIASHYKLDNLVAVLDVNRLEEVGTTVLEWDLQTYKARFESFGWHTILVEDGHNIEQVAAAYSDAANVQDKPVVIIAKTIKGKGVKHWENQIGWHAKVLKPDELEKAIPELGKIDFNLTGEVAHPEEVSVETKQEGSFNWTNYSENAVIAPRQAYGNALAALAEKYPNIVVLDAALKNSTHAKTFAEKYPDRYFEMFIAEQNMVSTAQGLSRVKKIPFISTFAAFFTRAFDQIRMSQYFDSNIKFVGSHVGTSIGMDGPSQMGLEDIAMFRSVQNCAILYPSDAVSMERAVYLAAETQGNVYIRSTRPEVPILYSSEETFKVGGSKIVRESVYDSLTVVGAGITVHEAIKAYDMLRQKNIVIRVVDLFSIKPIDYATLNKCIRETKAILVVEDHYAEGGISEAIRTELANVKTKIFSLSVNKTPRSGKPEELLDYEEISAKHIAAKVTEILNMF